MVNSKPRFYSKHTQAQTVLVWAGEREPGWGCLGTERLPNRQTAHEFLPFSRDLADRCRSCRLLMRMIAGAHQRPRLDVSETEPQCFLFHLAKLGRRVEARHRQVIF